ncbi:MAG: ABC transporter permease subunit [Bacilli bacterium]|nr:ABC transporter permease subunit [Clostridium sp.]MDY6014942.1 ABC transporter permease subunit [Bacilli bacterium]
MTNLIKNELYKVFKRKSIYILLSIMLCIITLNTFLTKKYSIEDPVSTSAEEKYELQELKRIIDSYDKNSPGEKEEYYNALSNIELYELTDKYKEPWKKILIRENLRDIIHSMNNAKYIEKDIEAYNEYKKEYDAFLKELDSNSWKYFVNKEIKTTTDEIASLEKEREKAKNKELYNSRIKEEKNKLEKLKLRLEKDIPYDNNYLNTALEDYKQAPQTYKEFKESIIKNTSEFNIKEEYQIKRQYIEYMKNNANNKYIIDNKVDINSPKTTRNLLINTLSDNFLFIMIIVAAVAGSIVSTEFDKGTIKLLLIRPYSRNKILLSKYIVSMFMIIFAILSAFIMQLIIGGIFFGFSSLNIPVVIYNFVQNKVMHINLFKYIFDNVLAVLPEFILLATLAFAISTITNVSTLGVALPIVGVGAADIINLIAINRNIIPLKYFVTLNWNFTNYLYGGVNSFPTLSIPFSILICAIYFLIMIITAFIVFNKRNIKNI